MYNLVTGLLESRDNQTYTYYPNTDLVKSILSPDGVSSNFTYFGTQRVLSESQSFNGETAEVAFTYDNFFRPDSKTLKLNSNTISSVATAYRPDGSPAQIGEMNLSYDQISGRLNSTTVGQVKDYRTYDSFGNLATYKAVYNNNGVEELLYSYELGRDALHRIVTKKETIQGETNTYVYSYDLAGRLVSVSRNAVILSSYQYDLNGNRISGTVSGMPFEATYDNQDRLVSFTNPSSSTAVTSSFSAMVASSEDDDTTISKGPGRRNGRGRGHAYGPCDNPSNRGPRFNGNNGRGQDGCSGGSDDGGSDGGGTDGGIDGGTTGGTDGGGTDGGGTDGGSTGGGTTGGYGDYSYNDNGELTSVSKDSGITTFARDNLGQLKEVNVNSGKLISYALDWDGRRVAKSIEGVASARSIYEGSLQLSAVVAPDGSIKEYVYGTNINSPDYMKVGAATYRIIKDHLGSPRLVVNVTDGTISQRMDYNEWGEVLVDTNPGFQGFGFAGGLYDSDTRLVKFGARDYDPSVGRWLSKDPILFNGGDANLYGYVLQDPVNFIDPNGQKGLQGLILAAGGFIAIYLVGKYFLPYVVDFLLPDAHPKEPQKPNKEPEKPIQACDPDAQCCI